MGIKYFHERDRYQNKLVFKIISVIIGLTRYPIDGVIDVTKYLQNYLTYPGEKRRVCKIHRS